MPGDPLPVAGASEEMKAGSLQETGFDDGIGNEVRVGIAEVRAVTNEDGQPQTPSGDANFGYELGKENQGEKDSEIICERAAADKTLQAEFVREMDGDEEGRLNVQESSVAISDDIGREEGSDAEGKRATSGEDGDKKEINNVDPDASRDATIIEILSPDRNGDDAAAAAATPMKKDNNQNYDVCAVCNEMGNLLCCDTCPRVYHTSCLAEESPKEEEGAWSCGICTGRTTLRELVTLFYQRQKMEHVDLCFACLQGGELICCDRCPAAFHYRCAGMSNHPSKRISEHAVWLCPICEGTATHDELRKKRMRERRREPWFKEWHQRHRKREREALERRIRHPFKRRRSCAFCYKKEGSVIENLAVWYPELGGEAFLGCALGEMKGPWELREGAAGGHSERSNGGNLSPSNGSYLPSVTPSSSSVAKRVYAHRLCAIWAPMVFQAQGEWRNVVQEVKRSRGVICSECRKGGAAVGCCVASCKKSYHLSCAAVAHCYLDQKEHLLYCNHHYLTEKLKLSLPDQANSTGLHTDVIYKELAELKKAAADYRKIKKEMSRRSSMSTAATPNDSEGDVRGAEYQKHYY
eukprot:jgi/Bigna1/73238/fgenesh1_pg.23_\